MADSIVIVGAGQAGAQIAHSLRTGGYTGRLTLIGDEAHPPYQRPPLSKKHLSGEIDDAGLHLRPSAFYSQNEIDCRFASPVTAIDRAAKTVALEDGESVSYDKLVIATGTRPRTIPLPGASLPGVVTLRKISDIEAMRPLLATPGRIAIVGAGYIGLEVAAVARAMGHEVVVVEAQDRVMKRVVTPGVSAWFDRMHRDNGVELRLETGVAGFTGDDRVRAVTLADGHELACDMVLVAVGAVPNDELATAAGLETDDGILVDGAGRTSDPDIFAAGDCTRFFSTLYGRSVRLESVQNAIDQGKAVAATLLGGEVDYDPVPWFWSDQYKTKLQIAGLSQDYDDARTFGDPASGSFFVAYLKEGRLIAVDSINHPRSHMMARRAIGSQFREDLLPAA
ncbi:NAD(P)/FAD-dependent oxidoreductase [Stappia sp.]|jgi:3-phenylpropionate/trans-cinnamate dioxygenase ferredoxin reductase subunit|uniref:NAD(P)/FAD-dependent oxidoreductase n=1 Tax=Stappia sp. TaxID=1870903 RepID=UPI003A99D7D2